MADVWSHWHFTKYDKSKELAGLKAAARKSKVGLWADRAPVAPWDWRATEAVRHAARRLLYKGIVNGKRGSRRNRQEMQG